MQTKLIIHSLPLLAAVFMSLLFPSAVQAQAPQTMSYQGLLTNVDGTPVASGNFSIAFQLYGQGAGGTALWSETQSVTLVNGIFSVILGRVTPLSLPFDQDYWLGVTVGDGDETTPRVELTASPYSLHAVAIADSSVTTSKVKSNAITIEKIAPDVVSSINSVGNDGGDIELVAGSNVSISPDAANKTITISATPGGGGGDISAVNAGTGLAGGGTVGDVTLRIADDGVDGQKIADGTVVRSINNITDAVTLRGAGGATISTSGDTVIINSGHGSGASSWSLIGNAGTNPSQNFLGTTDKEALELRVNNERTLRLEPAFDEVLGSSPNLIGGHQLNEVTGNVAGATIAGGGAFDTGQGTLTPNRVTANYGTVSGGQGNQAGGWATVSGGLRHTASGLASTVGGGETNTASEFGATVGGGASNTVSAAAATVSGGHDNLASGNFASVGGGEKNAASGLYSTIAGGKNNSANNQSATIAGGFNNLASGQSATVGGGANNVAAGQHSFAAGNRAKANHTGAFVWADNTGADFASTAENQFLIRATAGVGIGAINPGKMLVVGNGAGSSGIGNNGIFVNIPGGAAMMARNSTTGVEVQANAETSVGTVGTFSNHPLNFRTNNVERMRIGTDGSVGIGTINPGGPLHILKTATPPIGLPATENGLLLGTQGTSGYKWIQSYGGALALNPTGNNVGIGTTNPQQKLHVAGSFIRVDGPDDQQAYVGGSQFGNERVVVIGSLNPDITEIDLHNGASGLTMDLAVRDLIALGAKHFIQPHPGDPNKEIAYVALEGPEAGTYIRGTADLINGQAVITLPDYFYLVTSEDGVTVQLTPRNEWLQLYVVQSNTRQVIVREAQTRSGRFDYLVQGIRKGYENHQPIRERRK